MIDSSKQFVTAGLLLLLMLQGVGCQGGQSQTGGTTPSESAAIHPQVFETRVYDIRDLLSMPKEPKFDLNDALSSTSSGGDSKRGFWTTLQDRGLRLSRKAAVARITEHITHTADSPPMEKYDETKDGFIMIELNGNLIIRSTTTHHAKISELLSKQRAMHVPVWDQPDLGIIVGPLEE